MVRPSVADERRTQIIEATLRTIAAQGIAKTSLDRIADAAGMSRGHVRHFVGNRDQLLVDTARYLYSDGGDGELGVMPRNTPDLEASLEYFFGGPFTEASDEDAIVLGLAELAKTDENIAAVLAEAYGNTRRQLVHQVAAAYPRATPDECEWAAASILAAAMGNVFINDFDRTPSRTHQVRVGVERMVGSLSHG